MNRYLQCIQITINKHRKPLEIEYQGDHPTLYKSYYRLPKWEQLALLGLYYKATTHGKFLNNIYS